MVGAEAASPQPTVPSAASMRTSRFSACVMATPAIFTGFFSGSATGIASTRRMTSGGRAARVRRRRVGLHVLGHARAQVAASFRTLAAVAPRIILRCSGFRLSWSTNLTGCS